jgi:transposase-like protein
VILILIGATPEGNKELVGFHVGTRESAPSWREFLVDLKARGLSVAPEIAVGDGALGFRKALDEVFPGTRHQRCWMHKVSNVLGAMASRSTMPNTAPPNQAASPRFSHSSGADPESPEIGRSRTKACAAVHRLTRGR